MRPELAAERDDAIQAVYEWSISELPDDGAALEPLTERRNAALTALEDAAVALGRVEALREAEALFDGVTTVRSAAIYRLRIAAEAALARKEAGVD